MSLDALTLALRQGSQAKGNLAGLDEDYTRALDLSTDTNFNKIDKYGNVGTLGVIGDMIGQSQGRKKLRELRPERMAARSAIADNENALGLYQAKLAENKVIQDQTNVENKASALKQAAAAAAAAKASARNTPEAWVNPDGSGVVNGFNTDAGFVDGNGKRVNIEGKVPFKEHSLAINKASGRGGKAKDDEPSMLIEDNIVKLLDPEQTTNLSEATGKFDPQSLGGILGIGHDVLGEDVVGGEIQSTQNLMANIGIQQTIKNLDQFGSKPSDMDLKVSLGDVPDRESQPIMWANWAKNIYVPHFRIEAEHRMRTNSDASKTQGDLDYYLSKVTEAADKRLAHEYGGENAPQPAPQAGMRYPDDPEKQARFDAYKARQGI